MIITVVALKVIGDSADGWVDTFDLMYMLEGNEWKTYKTLRYDDEDVSC